MYEPAADASGDETGQSSRSAATQVTVRYWAAARAAAGRVEDEVDGHAVATVADVLVAVRALHAESPRFDQVLAISSLLLGDRPIRTADLAGIAVAPGDVVEVLPPFAGG
jgi:molybdopterin synthase sulfur carrier subunit